MDKQRWGLILQWAAVAAGAGFCLYFLVTGSLAFPPIGAMVVLGMAGTLLRRTLTHNADMYSTYGLAVLSGAACLELLYPRHPRPPGLGTLGAVSLGLGLVLSWVATRRGEPAVGWLLGPAPRGRGELAFILFYLVLLAVGLLVTFDDSRAFGWDGWLVLQGAGAVTGLLLVARQLAQGLRVAR